MGVTGQVGQHHGRTGEGPFGVHHPFTTAQRFEPLGERVGVGQGRELTEELQMAVGVRLDQAFEEEPPKQPRQHPHREEETGLAGDPALTIRQNATAGHDAVHIAQSIFGS